MKTVFVLTYRDCFDFCKSLALEIIEAHKDKCDTLEGFMGYAAGFESAYLDDHSHQFLAAINRDLRLEAEDTLRHMGATPESYDDYASQLTYWAINIWVARFVEECLQEAA